MPTVYEVPASDLIEALTEKLQKAKNISPPDWASFVKTGCFKDRTPHNPDWWYVRCASLLRKVYINGPIGLSHLRKIYGGTRKGRNRPERFVKASGAIIRKALQQLEAEGLLTSDKRGRRITPAGQSMLDKLAAEIIDEKYPELKKY
ncbi:MAG: 30S ribosomal protein S19e [Asgard group archaeon]|nr:30S ribosomal protein S19e [Asgard group archaeon]